MRYLELGVCKDNKHEQPWPKITVILCLLCSFHDLPQSDHTKQVPEGENRTFSLCNIAKNS